jgi:transcription antitermination factor NusG
MRINPGDTAWVQGGPFAGFHATIIQLDADGTARVALDIS